MSESVSQRQFAKHIGRSHVWVSKLVKAGKIPLDDNGKIPLAAGLAAYESSQAVGHDGSREYHAKQRQKTKKESAAPNPKPAPARAKRQPDPAPAATSLPDDDAPAGGTANLTTAKLNEAYNKARLAEKSYQAKLKQLEWEREFGSLLTRDEVRADAMRVAEELHGMLMPMGNRIAPLCEGKSAREIEVIIEDAIQEALITLRHSTFTHDKEERAARIASAKRKG